MVKGEVVLIESPYGSEKISEVVRNICYARACVRDSVIRGEFPLASHLFFTQPGILDDNISEERQRGIDIGLAIGGLADRSAFYMYFGESRGMKYARDNALKSGREIEERTLGDNWLKEYSDLARNHSQRDVWEKSCNLL